MPEHVLVALERGLLPRFGRAVETIRRDPPRPEWLDPVREQLHSDAVLDALAREPGPPETWRLGVVDADLFVPRLNFVFGQATVGGCCAVIGLARLRPERDRGESGRKLFERRALVEAVHELGHVAGLEHCPDPGCVMHFSNTLADTDRKGSDFCDRCAR